MAWMGEDRICLGHQKDYAMVEVNSGLTTQLFSLNAQVDTNSRSVTTTPTLHARSSTSSLQPLITAIPNSEEMILAKDGWWWWRWWLTL